MPPWCKIQVYLLCRSKICPKQVNKGLKDIEQTTHWAKKSDLTLILEHVTWKSIGNRQNPCTKFVIESVKRYWADNTVGWKSGLTLTFENVTWKSIGIIYSSRATPAPSLVLIKWRGQKILSGQHSGLRRVVWPWPLNMWPENQ